MCYRHYMYEQRLDRLAWKIEYSAIQLLNDGQLRQMISPGRPRVRLSPLSIALLSYFRFGSTIIYLFIMD